MTGIDMDYLDKKIADALDQTYEIKNAWWELPPGKKRCAWKTGDGWRCINEAGHDGHHQDTQGFLYDKKAEL